MIVAHEASVRSLRSFLLPPHLCTVGQDLAERERVDTTVAASPDSSNGARLFEFLPSELGAYEEKVQDMSRW